MQTESDSTLLTFLAFFLASVLFSVWLSFPPSANGLPPCGLVAPRTTSCYTHIPEMPGSGRLGGSVGKASNFGSGQDLVVGGFETHVGLCADSLEPEPASDSVSPSLSALPPPPCSVSVSLKYK